MKKHFNPKKKKNKASLREKIIGLGDRSIRKSYYSQLKEHLEKLKESEGRFRELAELLPQVVFEIDEKGNLLFANRYAFDAFGYTQDDFDKGLNVFQMLVPEDRERVGKDILRVLNGEYVGGIEYNALRKEGSTFPVLAYASPVIRENKPVGLRGILIDITDRKQADEVIRREKNKAQKYLDIAAVMLVAIDADQRVTLINKKGCEILGYKEDEIIGKNWFDHFLPERIRTDIKSVYIKILEGKVEFFEYYENPVLTKSGEEKVIAWHNTLLTDENGHIIGTLSSGEDITERKQTEEALRNSVQQWQATFDAMNECIFLLDPSFTILRCNKASYNILGKTPVELVGRKCWEVVHNSSGPVDWCPVARMQKTLQRESSIVEIGERWIEVYTNPLLDSKGNFAGAVHVIADITERIKVEKEIKKRIKELEDFYDIAIGRELKIKEMKEEIEELQKELAQWRKQKFSNSYPEF